MKLKLYLGWLNQASGEIQIGKFQFCQGIFRYACRIFETRLVRVMNKVLEGFLDEFCLVYLDDIIIWSDNEEDHLKHVQRVIERLRKYNMKIKLSKCKFARTKIEYLSHIIENGELKTNPDKIIAVANTPRPKNVKQLQSFLGLVSYYRKFIKP